MNGIEGPPPAVPARFARTVNIAKKMNPEISRTVKEKISPFLVEELVELSNVL